MTIGPAACDAGLHLIQSLPSASLAKPAVFHKLDFTSVDQVKFTAGRLCNLQLRAEDTSAADLLTQHHSRAC